MLKKTTSMLTRSSRRHIRAEKAKIRRSTTDVAVRAQKMAELYAKFGLTVAGDHYAR